jgi:hypothetical protein
MATSLASLASLTVQGTLTSALVTIGSGTATVNKSYGSAFTQGTGAGQCDLLYFDERTLTASSNESLDLSGSILDAFGNAVIFARIKALAIFAAATNTNNVLVGGVTNGIAGLFTSATAGIAVVRPGAFLAWGCGSADATGYVVTAGTGDLLKIANSAGSSSVVYDIFVLGCSA